MNKLGGGIAGGLGDVTIRRKLEILLRTPQASCFELVSIADIYEEQDIRNPEKFEQVFEEIKKKRLKGKVDPFIEASLKNALRTSLSYHKAKDGKLPEEFFRGLDFVDISTPNGLHFPLTYQVLTKTSAHLILEKPAVASLEEAIKLERLLKEVNLSGRVVMDAEHYSHYGNVMAYILNFQRFCKDCNGGEGLGKVRGIELVIKEDEDFSNERNQQTIEIKKSGGGLGLDTGIHAIAFLRNIGAEIDGQSAQVKRYKSHDPRIQDDKYGETAASISIGIKEGEYFAGKCLANITVGKCCDEKRKNFSVEHENGRVEMDISQRTLGVYKKGKRIYSASYEQDAFYNVFDCFRKSIQNQEQPFSSISKSIENAKDIFTIMEKSQSIEKLSKGHEFSAKPE